MRAYELMIIIHPDLEEAGVTDVINRVSGWITDSNGKVTKTDLWGKRQLAYLIRKQKEGQYVLLHVELDPSACSEIERNLRLLEPIMRYSLISQED